MKKTLLTLFICLVVGVCAIVGAEKPQPGPTGMQNGCLIFWKGGTLAGPIIRRTNSDITHAAILLNGFVYEAVPPRVHKVPLATYINQINAKIGHKNFSWFMVAPKKPYSKAELDKMVEYAERQLGRPYQLRGWWKGHEVRGLFCSQYVGNILEKSDRIKSGGVRESPGTLYKKIKDTYQ